MLETVNLAPQPGVTPQTAIDIWWILSTIVTTLLLAIVVFFLKRLVDSFDKVKEILISLRIEQTAISTELHAHIENKGEHCKAPGCGNFIERRS